MSHAESRSSLHVSSEGGRRFIQVSSGQAAELHTYLRSKGIGAAPPEPSSTNMENIELRRGVDVGTVQALLDQWA